MKKILIASFLLLGLGTSYTGTAQVRINLNIGTNVRHQPWYASDNNYYYLPEQGVYYNVTKKVYVYSQNGNWYYASRLPRQYNGFNYRQSHYVAVREVAPYRHHEQYQAQYRRNNNDRYHRYDQNQYGGYRRDNRNYGHNHR